jgi:membrane protease YdiL (CAAX protease family)
MKFQLNELKMDWRVVVTLMGSTILIVIDQYNAIFPEKWMDHALLFMVIPFLLVKVVFRQSLVEFGFRWGDWKAGTIFTFGGWVLMTVVVFFVARTPDFLAYYTNNQEDPFRLILTVAFTLFGWEFLFRGWLLFTLLPICGPYALILQAIPFTIAHFGKPELETISCIIGGPVFGYVAWRTRSFLYPFFIHWYLTTITVLMSRIPF